ncbi:MAG: AMP-binding protein [Acidimicrobiia bacterium]
MTVDSERSWSFARAWRTVAELQPDRTAIVCGTRRLSFADLDVRAGRLACVLRDAGVVADDKVAIMCVNSPEYLEAFFAAQKLGAVPVNVNYRYVGAELAYLLDNSDSVALVFDDQFAPAVAEALAALANDRRPRLLLQVARAAGRDPIEGALDYTRTVAAAPTDPPTEREPSGDDLVFVYTGGTTGSPKAVMWRSDDLYVSLWHMARPGTQPPDVDAAMRADKRAATCLPACPLMHGTGLFIALSTLAGGGTVVLLDTPRLDPNAVWDAIERERVQVCTIVGDAFARPLLAALDGTPGRWDLSGLRAITSSGVTWSPQTKRGLLRHLPHVLLIDSLGASEGIMTRTETRDGDEIAPARFRASDRVVVVTDDGGLAQPGDNLIGLLGVGGAIPLGYYKDPEKTAATFRSVGGRRYSIPGDYAAVESDGTIRLLGRGSACINTGGEKVYPEEVELALRAHVDVFDCIVVGIPDERWGEMVVALVHTRDGQTIDTDALAQHCRATLAAYKVPKHMLVVDSLERSPAGKADYKQLREIAVSRVRSEVIP